MTTQSNMVRTIGFTLVLVASLSSMSTASHAYTPEEQRLCMSDSLKFCSSVIMDPDKVTACLKQHAAQLSPGCKSVGDNSAGNAPNNAPAPKK
jgi:hypothetical protein